MVQNKYRVQVVDITIPNGTAAGATVNFEDKLRSDYDRCIGYAIQEVENTNNEGASIQVSTTNDIIHDFVHYAHLQPGPGAPMSDRYHKADFKSADEKIFIKAKMIPAATADIRLQVIFLLEKLN